MCAFFQHCFSFSTVNVHLWIFLQINFSGWLPHHTSLLSKKCSASSLQSTWFFHWCLTSWNQLLDLWHIFVTFHAERFFCCIYRQGSLDWWHNRISDNKRQSILMQCWGHFDKENCLQLGPNFVHRNARWHLVLDQFEALVQPGLCHKV